MGDRSGSAMAVIGLLLGTLGMFLVIAAPLALNREAKRLQDLARISQSFETWRYGRFAAARPATPHPAPYAAAFAIGIFLMVMGWRGQTAYARPLRPVLFGVAAFLLFMGIRATLAVGFRGAGPGTSSYALVLIAAGVLVGLWAYFIKHPAAAADQTSEARA